MATAIENIDPENDLVQLLVTEAVKIGLKSPLRDPILKAVEESTGESLDGVEGTTGESLEAVEESAGEPFETTAEDDASGTKSKIGLMAVLEKGIVFAVLFVVLYGTLRRLTGSEPDR